MHSMQLLELFENGRQKQPSRYRNRLGDGTAWEAKTACRQGGRNSSWVVEAACREVQRAWEVEIA